MQENAVIATDASMESVFEGIGHRVDSIVEALKSKQSEASCRDDSISAENEKLKQTIAKHDSAIEKLREESTQSMDGVTHCPDSSITDEQQQLLHRISERDALVNRLQEEKRQLSEELMALKAFKEAPAPAEMEISEIEDKSGGNGIDNQPMPATTEAVSYRGREVADKLKQRKQRRQDRTISENKQPESIREAVTKALNSSKARKTAAKVDKVRPKPRASRRKNVPNTTSSEYSESFYLAMKRRFFNKEFEGFPFNDQIWDEGRTKVSYYLPQQHSRKPLMITVSDEYLTPMHSTILPLVTEFKQHSAEKCMFAQDCIYAQIPELQVKAAAKFLDGKDLKAFTKRTLGTDLSPAACKEEKSDPNRWASVIDKLVAQAGFRTACKYWIEGEEADEAVCWPPNFKRMEVDEACALYKSHEHREEVEDFLYGDLSAKDAQTIGGISFPDINNMSNVPNAGFASNQPAPLGPSDRISASIGTLISSGSTVAGGYASVSTDENYFRDSAIDMADSPDTQAGVNGPQQLNKKKAAEHARVKKYFDNTTKTPRSAAGDESDED